MTLDMNDVLARNPRVNPVRVKAYAAFIAKMKRLGLDVEPAYRIDSPLGRLARPAPQLVALQRSR